MKAQYPVPVFWSSTQFASRCNASGLIVVVVGVVVVVVGTVVVVVVVTVVVVVVETVVVVEVETVLVVMVVVVVIIVVVSAQFGTGQRSLLTFGSVV